MVLKLEDWVGHIALTCHIRPSTKLRLLITIRLLILDDHHHFLTVLQTIRLTLSQMARFDSSMLRYDRSTTLHQIWWIIITICLLGSLWYTQLWGPSTVIWVAPLLDNLIWIVMIVWIDTWSGVIVQSFVQIAVRFKLMLTKWGRGGGQSRARTLRGVLTCVSHTLSLMTLVLTSVSQIDVLIRAKLLIIWHIHLLMLSIFGVVVLLVNSNWAVSLDGRGHRGRGLGEWGSRRH